MVTKYRKKGYIFCKACHKNVTAPRFTTFATEKIATQKRIKCYWYLNMDLLQKMCLQNTKKLQMRYLQFDNKYYFKLESETFKKIIFEFKKKLDVLMLYKKCNFLYK